MMGLFVLTEYCSACRTNRRADKRTDGTVVPYLAVHDCYSDAR